MIIMSWYYDHYDTSSRKDRAYTQNIYLLDTIKSDNEHEKIFKVVGTTGNVYTVSINEHSSCSCPDHTNNGNTCKHIYFIMLRVMKHVGSVKKSWKNPQLQQMFKNIPMFIENNLVVNNKAKINYEQNIKNILVKVEQKFDDICPICLDNIGPTCKNTDYCKYSCGKSVHKLCLSIWSQSKNNVTSCIFCRASWHTDDFSDVKSDEVKKQYVNIYSIKLAELQKLCVFNNISKYGPKYELIDRLKDKNII